MKKIGRNDPCYCNSGLKYKKCHLRIDTIKNKIQQNGVISFTEEESRILGNINREYIQKFFKKQKCIYPNCDKKPISSHTFSRSLLEHSLGEEIEGENPGKYVYHSDIQRIFSSFSNKDQRDFLYKTLIKNAGTLPLFCSEHDDKLFSSIENRGQKLSVSEYIFMLSYRFFMYDILKDNFIAFTRDNEIIGENHSIHKKFEKRFIELYNEFQKNTSQLVQSVYNRQKHLLMKESFEQIIVSNNLNKETINEKFEIKIYNLKKDVRWAGVGFTEFVSNGDDIYNHYPSGFGVIPSFNGYDACFFIISLKEEAQYLESNLYKLFDGLYLKYVNNNDIEFLASLMMMVFDSSENIMLSPSKFSELKEAGQYEKLEHINSLLTRNKSLRSTQVRREVFGLCQEVDLF